MRRFLKLFVNGVKQSGSIPIDDFCAYVRSRLLVVLKEQGLLRHSTSREGLCVQKQGANWAAKQHSCRSYAWDFARGEGFFSLS